MSSLKEVARSGILLLDTGAYLKVFNVHCRELRVQVVADCCPYSIIIQTST